MMIEEREFRSVKFWRDFDAGCRAQFDGADIDYLSASLCVFFVVISVGGRSPSREYEVWPDASSLFDNSEADFREKWNSYFDRIFRRLGSQRGARFAGPPPIGANFFRRAIDVYEAIRYELEDVDGAHIFDHRFLILAAKTYGIDRRFSHLTAVLSNTLAESSECLIEAFCATGEMFLTSGGERWRRGKRWRRLGVLRQVGGLDLELRMRLALYGIDPIEALATVKDLPWSRAFIQIDGPSRVATNKSRGQSLIEGDSLDSATTTMEMLHALIHDRLIFEGVIVVSGAERTSLRTRMLELRARLVESGKLLAVIDLPKVPGSSAARSAWVLQSEHRAWAQEILMVDLRALGLARSHHEFGVLAEFAGRLVLNFRGDHLSVRWATLDAGVEMDRLRQIFEREFSSGYRDVEGLCRSVSRQEVLHGAVNLSAVAYVLPPERSAWLSGIDGRAIAAELSREGTRGRSIYVIGNNGEGKSLLLRELATLARELGRTAVGISFGTSDRFSFGRNNVRGHEHFRYEGARTSTDGASARKAASDICQKMMDIHCDPKRLDVFNRVLELLDFEAKRYVVSIDGRDHGFEMSDALDSMFELTGDFDVNRQLRGRVDPKGMQPAFMRSRTKSGITPFTDLSSGEQQMLALTTKIVATADLGSLILVDEPEISLHVSWQRMLPTIFNELANRFECDIVIATHSPLVISSATHTSDVCFAARRQRLELISIRDRQSVESILFTGFGTHTENNRLVHERCAALVAEGIRLSNQENFDAFNINHLLDELRNMRRTVLSSRVPVDTGTSNASVQLISKARDALMQLASWRQRPNQDNDEVTE